jgi:hypothetical protein
MHPIIKKRLLAKLVPAPRRVIQADRDHAALSVLIEQQARLIANRERRGKSRWGAFVLEDAVMIYRT